MLESCLIIREEDAGKAFMLFNGRWYGGRQLQCEYTVINRWKNALCGKSINSLSEERLYSKILHLIGILHVVECNLHCTSAIYICFTVYPGNIAGLISPRFPSRRSGCCGLSRCRMPIHDITILGY